MMKSLLLLVCSFVALGAGLSARQDKDATKLLPISQGNQVETEKDRFSGDVTIKLKPQMIYETPDHFITMAMETKFTGKRPDSSDVAARTVEDSREDAYLKFDSQAKIVTDFGDEELHFIADGKSINVGKCAGGVGITVGQDRDAKPGFRVRDRYVAILKTDQLVKLAKSDRVEMRLGTYQMTLNSQTLGKLREFVTEYTKYAPSTQSKGKRP